MDINSLIDKLNNYLEKLNNLKKESIDTNTFFTDDISFNNDFVSKDTTDLENKSDFTNDNNIISTYNYTEIEPDNETTSLVTLNERKLLVAQNMFKKSIRISLKSFLISISLSFLNLFI